MWNILLYPSSNLIKILLKKKYKMIENFYTYTRKWKNRDVLGEGGVEMGCLIEYEKEEEDHCFWC